ncbi:hypothetical protein MTR_2g037860 [Medicago truncatula]|uniref:Uncharacterized protein n=1 Tax=Medicago truncatula TaxID=3880 RepID=G7IG68_MEDTR|nr:hypothetical protein MTR_2g037860 [Medicago truncatula]
MEIKKSDQVVIHTHLHNSYGEGGRWKLIPWGEVVVYCKNRGMSVSFKETSGEVSVSFLKL